MTFETFALGLLAGFFIWRLYRAFDKKPQMPRDKIRLVSKETGEVLEMQIIASEKKIVSNGWDEKSFIVGAKFAFQKILSAFANCDLKTLKNSLSSDVYEVFEQDIMSRKAKKHQMDFSLICFDSADIVKKTEKNDEITVRFTTEQINLLKDEKGEVIEGDKMSISTMTDTWVFKKIGKDAWIITATESRTAPCLK